MPQPCGRSQGNRAACTAVQQPHTEPALTAQHTKWMRAAFLQAVGALVSKSSGAPMLLLPGSPVLTRAPCAAPASPRVSRSRGSSGTGLGPLCCEGSEDSAETNPGSRSSAAAVQHHLFTPLCPSRVLHRALGPAVLRKAPSEAALSLRLSPTGTMSCSALPAEGAAAAAAGRGARSHEPAGSSLSTPVTVSTKRGGARG